MPLEDLIELRQSAVLGLGQVPPEVDDERCSETYKDEQKLSTKICLIRVELEKAKC